jgi:Ran GTPase-activating protein (RanGAP) involved in mRNA processing and transport
LWRPQINLCRRGIGPKEALLLREAIISNQQLSVVRLSYNDLRDEGTTSIAEAVSANGRHHASLSTLDLGFNSIGDQGCEAISVHALAGNYVLGTLYLSGNRVRDKGAISIAGAILHGSALSELHLTANSIKSIGLKALAGAIAQADVKMRQEQLMQNGLPIRRKSLTKLYLGCTEFDESGFVAVPGMLLTNTSLQSLCLTSNNINDQGVALLSQALTHNKALPLETLELSFNEITDQGLECLMNAIWGSQTLKHLKLDNNRLKDRGAQLCAVVLTSVPLRLLDVSCNTITTVGIKALMKNVSDSESLESFGMSGIPVDQNGSKAISYALAYNSSLSVLRMDNCSAGYSAQRHIVAGMVSNCRGSMRVFTGFDIARKWICGRVYVHCSLCSLITLTPISCL